MVETYLLIETREKIKSPLQVLDVDRGCETCGSSRRSRSSSSSCGSSGSWTFTRALILICTTKASPKPRSTRIDVSQYSCNSMETFCDFGFDGELLCGRNGMRAGVDGGAIWVASSCCCCASERTTFVLDCWWWRSGTSKGTRTFVLD